MKIYTMIKTCLIFSLFTGCAVNNQPQIDSKKFKLEKNKDYLAQVGKDNKLYVIDAKKREIANTCDIVGSSNPGALIISDDGRKAYVLQNSFQGIYGYDLETCANFFQASLSKDNIRGISMFSLAISKDGNELYTTYTPAQKNIDTYTPLDPVFAVFDTNAGLNAQSVRSFKAPRQTTIMSIAHDGKVYSVGSNIYEIDPKTGDIKVKVKLRNWDKGDHSSPDSLAMWPIGKVSNEFMVMYTAAKFNDKEKNIENADFVWGATRIDLTTGAVEQEDFAPIETVMFTGMTHPKDSNILYGALTELTKFDRKNQKVIKRVNLDHTYYCLNFATDGSEIYIGGTYNDIAVYDPETLDKVANIVLPDSDAGAGTLQVFRVQ